MTVFKLGLCTAMAFLLGACSWNTYTKNDGSTGFRATSSMNQAVYYEDGTYSSNMKYNEHRPVRHVLSAQTPQKDENTRISWQ